MSEMRVDWGGVRTLHGVGLDPGLVEAVVSARDMEQGYRDLMALEDVMYYNRCLSEAALLVTSELVEAVCTGRCYNLVKVCDKFKTKRFILISTDKSS